MSIGSKPSVDSKDININDRLYLLGVDPDPISGSRDKSLSIEQLDKYILGPINTTAIISKYDKILVQTMDGIRARFNIEDLILAVSGVEDGNLTMVDSDTVTIHKFDVNSSVTYRKRTTLINMTKNILGKIGASIGQEQTELYGQKAKNAVFTGTILNIKPYFGGLRNQGNSYDINESVIMKIFDSDGTKSGNHCDDENSEKIHVKHMRFLLNLFNSGSTPTSKDTTTSPSHDPSINVTELHKHIYDIRPYFDSYIGGPPDSNHRYDVEDSILFRVFYPDGEVGTAPKRYKVDPEFSIRVKHLKLLEKITLGIDNDDTGIGNPTVNYMLSPGTINIKPYFSDTATITTPGGTFIKYLIDESDVLRIYDYDSTTSDNYESSYSVVLKVKEIKFINRLFEELSPRGKFDLDNRKMIVGRVETIPDTFGAVLNIDNRDSFYYNSYYEGKTSYDNYKAVALSTKLYNKTMSGNYTEDGDHPTTIADVNGSTISTKSAILNLTNFDIMRMMYAIDQSREIYTKDYRQKNPSTTKTDADIRKLYNIVVSNYIYNYQSWLVESDKLI